MPVGHRLEGAGPIRQNACLLEQFEICEQSPMFQKMNCLMVALPESTVGGIKLDRQERIFEEETISVTLVYLSSSSECLIIRIYQVSRPILRWDKSICALLNPLF